MYCYTGIITVPGCKDKFSDIATAIIESPTKEDKGDTTGEV